MSGTVQLRVAVPWLLVAVTVIVGPKNSAKADCDAKAAMSTATQVSVEIGRRKVLKIIRKTPSHPKMLYLTDPGSQTVPDAAAEYSAQFDCADANCQVST
jgi:hypothetical protein